MRPAAIDHSRSRTRSGRLAQRPIANLSSTALDSLLTFWPPGPEARRNVPRGRLDPEIWGDLDHATMATLLRTIWQRCSAWLFSRPIVHAQGPPPASPLVEPVRPPAGFRALSTKNHAESVAFGQWHERCEPGLRPSGRNRAGSTALPHGKAYVTYSAIFDARRRQASNWPLFAERRAN